MELALFQRERMAREFRFLSSMTSVFSDPKLARITLGQLINEYLDNNDEYRKIIPKKYEPLLEYCNTYRVFSVHPKKGEDKQVNGNFDYSYDISVSSG